MAVLALTILGIAAGGAAFAYARKRKLATKPSAAVGGVAGVAAIAAASTIVAAWPLVLIGGAAAAYFVVKNKRQKALKPAD